jgi:G patch domain-containing protein 1
MSSWISQLGEINVSLVNAVVVPVTDTVGIKLMRLMGWREGQGLGPRRKRKNVSDEHESQFTFAPRESLIQKFEARKDQHGLGYQPEKLMHHQIMESQGSFNFY